MAGHTVILNLLGGVALLIWATQMVRKGVMDAFGARLRQAIGRATSGRMRACAAGLGVATALQSSSATGLLVVAFAERGLIALAPALAVMLGADIGSTLVVQALSFKTAALVPVLLILGVGGRQRGKVELLAADRPHRHRSWPDDPVARPDRRRLAAIARARGLHPRDGAPRGRSDPRARHGSALHLARPFERRRRSARDLARRARASSACRSRSPSCSAPMSDPASSRSALPCARLRRRSACFSAISPSAASARWSALVAIGYGADLLPLLGSDPARAIANAHTGFNVVLALAFLPLVGPVGAPPRARGARCERTSEKRVNHLDEIGARPPRHRARQCDARSDAACRHRRADAPGDDPDLPRGRREPARRISRLDNDVDRLQEDDQALSRRG